MCFILFVSSPIMLMYFIKCPTIIRIYHNIVVAIQTSDLCIYSMYHCELKYKLTMIDSKYTNIFNLSEYLLYVFPSVLKSCNFLLHSNQIQKFVFSCSNLISTSCSNYSSLLFLLCFVSKLFVL